MVRLLGIYVLYREPLPGKHYTEYAELESEYKAPLKVGCIFDEHPDQQTLRKLGWMSELDSSSSIIHVDYDLPGLQQGALFIVPSAFDNTKGRIFRVTKLFAKNMIYPASIACEIVPEYIDTLDKETINDYSHSDFNLVNEEPETPQFLNEFEDGSFHTGLLQTEDDR